MTPRAAFLAGIACVAISPPLAAAATFTVAAPSPDVRVDAVELRQAMAAASASAGFDVVRLSPGQYHLNDCKAGTLVASDPAGVYIDGRGATIISSCPSSATFTITGRARVQNLVVAPTGVDTAGFVVTGHLLMRATRVQRALGSGIDCRGCGSVYILSSQITGSGSSGVSAVGGAGTQIVTWNAQITGNRSNSAGGGIRIASDQTGAPRLRVFNSTITANSAVGADASGGGIAADGARVYVGRSTISSNVAGDSEFAANGGGVSFRDAGRSDAVLQIANSNIRGNRASLAGGGIYAFGGRAQWVSRTWIQGNFAAGNGGGVAVGSEGTRTSSSIRNSTVAKNAAGPVSGGGGVSVLGTGRLRVWASTIAENSAGRGGGIDAGSARTDVAWSTLVRNSSTRGAQLASGLGAFSVNYSLVAQAAGGVSCQLRTERSGSWSLYTDDSCAPQANDRVAAEDAAVLAWTEGRMGQPPVLPVSPDSAARGMIPAQRCAQVLDQSGHARAAQGCTAGAVEPQ